jgi:hypothetical protein
VDWNLYPASDVNPGDLGSPLDADDLKALANAGWISPLTGTSLTTPGGGNHSRHAQNRRKVSASIGKAAEVLQDVSDSLKAVPLVGADQQADPRNPGAAQPFLTIAQANQLTSGLMAAPIGVLEKLPDPYRHGLDLEFCGRVMKEELLPLSENICHFLSHLRQVKAEPILKELEKELLKREASIMKFESAVSRWIAEIRQPPVFLGGKPYLASRAIMKEADSLLEDSIEYLKGIGERLHIASKLFAYAELGKDAYLLIKAALDPEARETHEVAYYTMATAIAACCVACAVFVGLELAVIGAVMGIAGGLMNAFLEPLAEQKYPLASLGVAAHNQMSKQDYDRAVQILRRAEGRSQ